MDRRGFLKGCVAAAGVFWGTKEPPVPAPVPVTFAPSLAATSTTTGALVVRGGLGVAKQMQVGSFEHAGMTWNYTSYE